MYTVRKQEKKVITIPVGGKMEHTQMDVNFIIFSYFRDMVFFGETFDVAARFPQYLFIFSWARSNVCDAKLQLDVKDRVEFTEIISSSMKKK